MITEVIEQKEIENVIRYCDDLWVIKLLDTLKETKELFIALAVDEIQPDWRYGADIKLETKQKLQQYVQNHYADIISPDNSYLLTFRSIDTTIKRIRKKLDIETESMEKQTK